MNSRGHLSVSATRVLEWFLNLAVQRAGFTVLTVPGWAGLREVSSAVGAAVATSDLVRLQAKLGRLHAHDARATGEPRPSWVYRLSQTGSETLARTLGVPAATMPPPPVVEETRIFVRVSTQDCIAGLRAALDNSGSGPQREWVPGETGWITSLELTNAMQREDETTFRDRYRWFTAEDLVWLVTYGYAQKRMIRDRLFAYRLTPAGAALQPLMWAEPLTSVTL